MMMFIINNAKLKILYVQGSSVCNSILISTLSIFFSPLIRIPFEQRLSVSGKPKGSGLLSLYIGRVIVSMLQSYVYEYLFNMFGAGHLQ